MSYWGDKLSGDSDDPTDIIDREFKKPSDKEWKEMIDHVISDGFYVTSNNHLRDTREADCRCFYEPARRITTSRIILPHGETCFYDVDEVEDYPERHKLYDFLNSIPEDIKRPKGYAKKLEFYDSKGPEYFWSMYTVTRHKNHRVTVEMTQIIRPESSFTNDFRRLFDEKLIFFSKTIEKTYNIKGLSEEERNELFNQDRYGIGEWYGYLPDFNKLIASKQIMVDGWDKV